MSNLFFVLRPSLTRLGISVGLFVLLSAILSNYINGLIFGLAMLGILILLYFVRERDPVQKIAHLDQDLWTIERKNASIQHMTLNSTQDFGFMIFLKMQTEEQKRVHICITKDQLEQNDWKKLKKFVKLN